MHWGSRGDAQLLEAASCHSRMLLEHAIRCQHPRCPHRMVAPSRVRPQHYPQLNGLIEFGVRCRLLVMQKSCFKAAQNAVGTQSPPVAATGRRTSSGQHRPSQSRAHPVVTTRAVCASPDSTPGAAAAGWCPLVGRRLRRDPPLFAAVSYAAWRCFAVPVMRSTASKLPSALPVASSTCMCMSAHNSPASPQIWPARSGRWLRRCAQSHAPARQPAAFETAFCCRR